jgi:lipopolysaccharide/colanic/teichoic acid biosynthesis glycosyltransferase
MSVGFAIKRIVDYGAAAAGLVVLSPVMLGIAAAIQLDSPGGALFVQERLGRGGKVFRLYKFRTMKPAPIEYNADGSTKVDAGDARVTRIGRFLRGSLDELPQLLNILRGEMSLVGPRPDLASQRALYDAGEEKKLDALPGITGLAVVVGRTDLPWKRRIAIDVHYVEHWRLGLDLAILAQTLMMPFGLRPFRFSEIASGE